MTSAENLYAVVISIYLIFFVLFARFFVWKDYSERHYWRRRPVLRPEFLTELAGRLGRPVPFISILVPARKEAMVIENTIRHMCSLRYPEGAAELIVITDEKELLAAEEERLAVCQTTETALSGAGLGSGRREARSSRVVLVSLLADLSLEEYSRREARERRPVGVSELLALPARDRYRVVREASALVLHEGGAVSPGKVRSAVKRLCPWLSALDVDRIYPACLAVAIPALAAYASLCDESANRVVERAIRQTVRANHELTQDIISRMTSYIARRIEQRVASLLETGEVRRRLQALVCELFPTTQEVVERTAAEMARRSSVIPVKHVIVPHDFDGQLGGRQTGKTVPSTKGRALNWGLGFIDPKTQVCGFYDAESRPHKDVLLYVAYRRLIDPVGSRVLQGPVFQVRNFYQMTPFCRLAALYQAIAHDWYLPWLFQTLPFVGGTNVFVERRLLETIGGWDSRILTEDLELGTRAYLRCGAWPDYLPYSSSEQTPPTFLAFFRQRLRWGTGHLQVVEKVGRDTDSDPRIRHALRTNLVLKGQVEWLLYQAATFVPPVAVVLQYRGLIDPSIVPGPTRWLLSAFSLVYFGFTIYAFKRYSPYLDRSMEPVDLPGRVGVYLGLLTLPLVAFMFPVPYTTACILKIIGREPKGWVKTPRTEEAAAAG